MTLKDFEFSEDNHFVAMEYHTLILNRTFLVIITRDHLIGLKVNGLVGAESGGSFLAEELSKIYAIKGNLQDPHSYVKEKHLKPMEAFDLLDPAILSVHRANFMIPRSEIRKAIYDPRKKWGMGYYPHDGKVYIETINIKKREFIILGNQSGHRIANMVMCK